jgi:uncharacterized membrane protein YfcA
MRRLFGTSTHLQEQNDDRPSIVLILLVGVIIIVFGLWYGWASTSSNISNYITNNPYGFGGMEYLTENLPYFIVILAVIVIIIVVIWEKRDNLYEYKKIPARRLR